HMAGQIPVDLDFLHALPEMARSYGTLFLFDEVVTGFRDSRGGWQELVGIKPDLSTIGKCAGGGLPVGAVIGREDILAALDARTPMNRRIIHSGTWNANPLVAAAGIAACSQYMDGIPQQKARQVARRFREGGNEIVRGKGISGRFYSRTVVHFYLGPLEFEPENLDWQAPTTDAATIMNPEMMQIRTRLCLHLLQRGIATFDGEMYVLSAAHTNQDVDRTLEALDDSLDAMIAEGSLPQSLMLK
ncbi:MAG: aminotransferase class III-fold pyridoxal phosphate-dependent enzyme, partial [Chloroflexi bacterium]|nr:aminotransferase class III-fold pyridoxal phosphate-dependent enzyme [Chloroflexota bacterium]